jgi:hypothetical protein
VGRCGGELTVGGSRAFGGEASSFRGERVPFSLFLFASSVRAAQGGSW